jgi:hypothetical protein
MKNSSGYSSAGRMGCHFARDVQTSGKELFLAQFELS